MSAELRMATPSAWRATSTQSPPLQKLLHRHRSAHRSCSRHRISLAPVMYYRAASGPAMLSMRVRFLSNGKLRPRDRWALAAR